MKEMDIFSTVEVEIFVIYMYYTVSLIRRIMSFIPVGISSTSDMAVAENTVSRMLKFAPNRQMITSHEVCSLL
jgi:hypothetical protein